MNDLGRSSRLPLINRASNTWVHPSTLKEFPTVQEILDPDADFTTVVLRLTNGTVFKTYNSFVLGPYLSEVYAGDFNGDGIQDFMAVKPGCGNGLAAEYCTGVFAFSEDGGYRFTRIRTMGLGADDLVLDPATKRFRLVHTSFREGEALDGRVHSFWVHRFYEWNGVAFQLDTRLSPIWIQFLARPNHEPTKLLTPKLKAKLWTEDADSGVEW